MEKIEIQFTLFSAFYSPLISAMSGGFLKEEGIEATYSVSPPGVSAIKALEDGEAQVIQSAPSQAFNSLAKGETPTAVHFAQINEMDGFFVTAREPDPDFSWKKLEGAEVVMFGGGQPLAMFQYACHKAGIDFSKIKPINQNIEERQPVKNDERPEYMQGLDRRIREESGNEHHEQQGQRHPPPQTVHLRPDKVIEEGCQEKRHQDSIPQPRKR